MVVVVILSILAACAGLGMWLHVWLMYRQANESAKNSQLKVEEIERGLAARRSESERNAAQLVDAGRRTLADRIERRTGSCRYP